MPMSQRSVASRSSVEVAQQGSERERGNQGDYREGRLVGWTLTPVPDGGTRLVTRVQQRYDRSPATVLDVVLLEFGDFPMMRQMLRGIRRRAESVRPETA
jgi:hypothetical protein